ncbi:MAG: hypothetical protein ACRDO8_02345, partial [Nocardioidaceae bacterium]
MTEDRPGPDEGSGDDDFDRIVAGLELSMPDDLDEPGAAGDSGAREPEVFDPRISDPLHEEDVERFVPPDPGPMPPLDAVSRGAWTVMV